MHGYGKLYFADGRIAYQGHMKDGKFNGIGTVYNDKSVTIPQVNWQNFGELGEQWISYEGEFMDDMRHGKGVIKLADGGKFYGSFFMDKVEGEGTYYAQNG